MNFLAILTASLASTAAGDPRNVALVEAGPGEGAGSSQELLLVFDPRPDFALHKSWKHEHELHGDPFINVDGDRTLVSKTRMRVETKHDFDVVDHYREVVDGRPIVLRRQFNAVERLARVAFRVGQQPFRGPGPFTQRTPLEKGIAVVFEWHGGPPGYGKHFDAQEREEWTLKGLTAELDLVALLPGRPVAVGESWEVPIQDLEAMLSPGGRLPYELSSKLDPQIVRTLSTGVGTALQNAFGGSDSGFFRLRLREVREEEGQRWAYVDIEADFKVAADRTDELTSWLSKEEAAAFGAWDEATLRLEFKGPGTLVWDLDGNHVRSLDLQFDEIVNVRLVRPTFDGEGGRKSERFEQVLNLRGTFASKLEATPVEAPPIPGPADD